MRRSRTEHRKFHNSKFGGKSEQNWRPCGWPISSTFTATGYGRQLGIDSQPFGQLFFGIANLSSRIYDDLEDLLDNWWCFFLQNVERGDAQGIRDRNFLNNFLNSRAYEIFNWACFVIRNYIQHNRFFIGLIGCWYRWERSCFFLLYFYWCVCEFFFCNTRLRNVLLHNAAVRLNRDLFLK